MSSEHHYADMSYEVGGSDFDHGGSMWNDVSVEGQTNIMSASPTSGIFSEAGTGTIRTMKDIPDPDGISAPAPIPYKFREDQLMAEIQAYIDGTYGQHYSRSKFQASEFIFDNGHGVGMNVGCIMKYAQRYGKKDGYNRKDIMKIIHYAILLLYVHDEYIAPKQSQGPVKESK